MVASPWFRVVNALERAWGPRRHYASKRSASKRRQQTIGSPRRQLSTGPRRQQEIKKLAASASKRRLTVSTWPWRLQAMNRSGVSKASAFPRCQRTRTTVVHSCRMSGSRRGRLHIQHNTMSTVTHNSKLNTAQPTYRRVCHQNLTHSYQQAHGKANH